MTILLTDTKLKILQMKVDGLPNNVIAQELNVSERTIIGHMRKVQTKLRANNTLHACALAVSAGIVQPSTPDEITFINGLELLRKRMIRLRASAHRQKLDLIVHWLGMSIQTLEESR